MPIYCEDPRLSVEVPGLDYKASPLPEGFDPEPLTRNDLQLFIAFAASFLDMSQVTQRVLGPAHKIGLRALMDARKEVLSKL